MVNPFLGLVVVGTLAGFALAFSNSNKIDSEVVSANPRLGHPANVIASGFTLHKIVEDADPLENPSGVITNFGFLNDSPPQLIERTQSPMRIRTSFLMRTLVDQLPGMIMVDTFFIKAMRTPPTLHI